MRLKAYLKSYLKNHKSPLGRIVYRVLVWCYSPFARMRSRLATARYVRMLAEERERVTVFAVQYLTRQLEGDIAEFGVRHGLQFAPVECRELAAWNRDRALHLFDSFQGYSPPTEADLTSWEVAGGKWPVGSAEGQVDPDTLRRRLEKIYKPGRVIIHKGFFADTLPKLDPSVRFGMVVMDAGLFSSTDTVLSHLFGNGHVSEGAIFLFNSWNTSRSSPAAGARKAWTKAREKFGIVYSEAGHFGWSGIMFIVHSYRRFPPVGIGSN